MRRGSSSRTSATPTSASTRRRGRRRARCVEQRPRQATAARGGARGGPGQLRDARHRDRDRRRGRLDAARQADRQPRADRADHAAARCTARRTRRSRPALPLGLVLRQPPAGPGRAAGLAVIAASASDGAAAPSVPRPGPRGWPGRGGGRVAPTSRPRRSGAATTVQVCGLWPFAAGTGSPMVGVPLGPQPALGRDAVRGPDLVVSAREPDLEPVDVRARQGRAWARAAWSRRMALGLTGYGVLPMVLGDLKPDYVDLIEALGGQVIKLGRGRGHLNVLDPGEAIAAADRLTGPGARAGPRRRARPPPHDGRGADHDPARRRRRPTTRRCSSTARSGSSTSATTACPVLADLIRGARRRARRAARGRARPRRPRALPRRHATRC